MKTDRPLFRTLLVARLVLVLVGCSGSDQSAETDSTTSTTPGAVECDFEIGPAFVKGNVSQASGGIGGWTWHSIQPLGCAEWFGVVNLAASEVAVTYSDCKDDCIPDGISSSIDTFEMELRGRFVLRADVPTENVDATQELVFVADGVAHEPDRDRNTISDIENTRWVFNTQVTRTSDGFVVGNTGSEFSLELTPEQAAEFGNLTDGETRAYVRLTGTSTGSASIVVESVETL